MLKEEKKEEEDKEEEMKEKMKFQEWWRKEKEAMYFSWCRAEMFKKIISFTREIEALLTLLVDGLKLINKLTHLFYHSYNLY